MSDYIDEMVEYRWCELVWNVSEVARATCSQSLKAVIVWEFVRCIFGELVWGCRGGLDRLSWGCYWLMFQNICLVGSEGRKREHGG